MKIYILVITAFFGLLVGGSSSAEKVVITAGGHAIGAADQLVTYSGECKAGKYEMQVDAMNKRIQYVLGPTNTVVDVTATNFGRTILTKSLAGTFGFACLKEELYTTFWGVDVPLTGEIKPVTYLFTLTFGGRIEEDRGLQEIDRGSTVTILSGKSPRRTLGDHVN